MKKSITVSHSKAKGRQICCHRYVQRQAAVHIRKNKKGNTRKANEGDK